jgi:hypothetical protein
MRVYMDESGSTGKQVLNNNEWNFTNQEYFVLTALLIDETQVGRIEEMISGIKHKYKLQGELKYKNKGHRKYSEEIIPCIMNELKKNNATLFIEIVNKRYDICKWITEYCIFPYYDTPDLRNPEKLMVSRMMANYVYTLVPDEVLNDFLSIVDSEERDINVLVNYCVKLKRYIKDDTLKEYINETMDSIKNYKRLGLNINNLFPIRDKLKSGETTIAVSPNIDSFNNIVSKCLMIKPDIKVLHDKQMQFDSILSKWVDDFKKKNKIEIEFVDSKKEALIQISDFISGYIREMITDKNKMMQSTEALSLLKDYINFVTTYSDALVLFGRDMTLLDEMYFFHKTYDRDFELDLSDR